MSSIINKLTPFFNRRDNEELNAIVSSVDKEIEGISKDIDSYMLECYIDTANGKWLDMWGLWFGTVREDGENDSSMRKRIKELSRQGITIPSLRAIISTYTNNSLEILEIYEPFNNLRKYSVSEFSGNDHYCDNDYWRHSVIDIKTSEELPQELKNIIEAVKGSGIKVHYSIVKRPKEVESDGTKML